MVSVLGVSLGLLARRGQLKREEQMEETYFHNL